MILYLARHGESSRPQPNKSAVLTDTGRQEVFSAARLLAERNPKPQMLWHSPILRAIQTAEIFREILYIPPSSLEEVEDLGPEGDIQTLYRKIAREKPSSLLVVSHLPFLDRFTLLLLGENHPPEASTFPTAGISIFEREKSWKWIGTLDPHLP